MPIWSDAYLAQLIDDAEVEIVNNELVSLFHRFSLQVTKSIATYTLPKYVKRIVRITWKGKKLEPLSQEELSRLDYQYRTTEGEPFWYSRIADGLYVIRFYPIINETVTSDDSGISGSDIENRVIVSCYRKPDTSSSVFQIPDYYARYLTKEYSLSRAFAVEGLGQNLKAALYYKNKYEGLSGLINEIKSSYQRAKSPNLREQVNTRPARPILSSDFGRVVDL